MISKTLAPGRVVPCCFSSHLSRFHTGVKVSLPAERAKKINVSGTRLTATCSFLGESAVTLHQKLPSLRRTALKKNSGRGALQVRNAIFGVGAPEAILVGVVALVVFGPKGLAEAAKSLGKAVRSFQPTIRELAEVSTDLRSTLEQEIGLEEIRDDFQSLRNPLNSPPTPKKVGSKEGSATPITEEGAKEIDPEIEAKRAKAAEMAWGGSGSVPPVLESDSVVDVKAEQKSEQKSEKKPEQKSGQKSEQKSSDPLAGLSTADLEAELLKRKNGSEKKSA